MTATAPGARSAKEPQIDQRVARRARREARVASRVASREERWNNFRYAVPYRTEGPKISLGLLWFTSIVAAAWVQGLLVIIPVSFAVTIGAFQLGHGWLTDRSAGTVREEMRQVISISTFRFL